MKVCEYLEFLGNVWETERKINWKKRALLSEEDVCVRVYVCVVSNLFSLSLSLLSFLLIPFL